MFRMTMNVTVFVVLCTLVPLICGHGSMIRPNQRGALSRRAPFTRYPVSDNTVIDYFMHFPAGDKSLVPGAGLRYQQKMAGPKGWTPYDPFDRNFVWRAGVCGDTLIGNDHLKGGLYYNGGLISAQYRQRGIIDVEVGVTAHHNGYIEVFVCDVSKCPGGDISPQCFQQGHCFRLKRALNDRCENRKQVDCAPADPKHLSRWYFPCKKYGQRVRNWRIYGPGVARFRLPRKLSCSHCVLQFYWVAANSCNPPGVVEFFKSKRSPINWRKCPGEGGATGGYAENQRECGGDRFPEEYYQCSDIRIVQRASVKQSRSRKLASEPMKTISPPPTKTPTPIYNSPATTSVRGVYF